MSILREKSNKSCQQSGNKELETLQQHLEAMTEGLFNKNHEYILALEQTVEQYRSEQDCHVIHHTSPDYPAWAGSSILSLEKPVGKIKLESGSDIITALEGTTFSGTSIYVVIYDALGSHYAISANVVDESTAQITSNRKGNDILDVKWTGESGEFFYYSKGNIVYGYDSVAHGNRNKLYGNYLVASGYGNNLTGNNAFAVGSYISVREGNGGGTGYMINIYKEHSYGMGENIYLNTPYSVGIGHYLETSKAGPGSPENPSHNFVGGKGTDTYRIRNYGEGSFLWSTNDEGQITNGGIRAKYAAILAGKNHDIPVGADGSVILGGEGIQAIRKQKNTTYVPHLNINSEPAAGSVDKKLLVRNAENGNVEAISADELLAEVFARLDVLEGKPGKPIK
jgi:hypothetical protein